MRQIHNNKTPQDKAVERLTTELTNSGLSPANIAWLVPYLDMTQPENPELLKQAKKQSVRTLTADQCLYLSAFLNNRLMSQNNKGYTQEAKNLQDRVIKAIFSILGTAIMHSSLTQARSWMDYGPKLINNPQELDRLLGDGAALALRASYWFGGPNAANSLKAAKPEQIEKALAFCTDAADTARVVLGCLWLAKQGGVLNALLGGGKKQEMIKLVQESAAALLPEVAPSLNPSDQTILVRYMKQDNVDTLPVKMQKIANSLGSRTTDTAAVGSACFLAMETAPALQTVFIVYAALHSGLTLKYSADLAGDLRFRAKIPWLIEHTVFHAVIPWLCTSRRHDLAIQIAKQYPEQFELALKGKDYFSSRDMIAILEQADPERAKRYQDSKRPGDQKQMVNAIVTNIPGFTPSDEAELKQFVLSGGDLSGLLARHPLNAGGGKGWGYHQHGTDYASQYGLDPFLARAIISMMFSGHSYHFYQTWNRVYSNLPAEQKHMGTLLDAVAAEGLPPANCLILAEWEDNHSYSQKDKNEIMEQTAAWMLKQPESLITETMEKGSAYARTLAAMTLEKKGDYDALLPLAQDSSKQVRKVVEDAFTARPFGEGPKAALKLLQSKKATPRETGIRILMNLDSGAEKKGTYVQTYRAQLEEALEKEKSGKLANALRALLGLEPVEADKKSVPAAGGDPVAETLKGGKKRKIQWVLDGTQQLASRAPGGALEDEDRLAAVMLCCIDSTGLSFAAALPDLKGIEAIEKLPNLATGRNVAAAKKLAEPLDAKELAAFAGAVFNLWLEQGAASKQKWVLTFSSVFGGQEMVENLKRQINQWPQESRGAIACDAVNALAISPEPEALLLVDSISRKFKFKQVKAAAGKALTFAAQALGLSTEELADRIVPDLGLDQRGTRTFHYGPRSFTVTLTPALELEIQNQEGKKIKSMPAPGKQDDPELANAASAEFKSLKKQIKATVSTQTVRLEQALSTGRIWTGAGWRELFVQKPIMRQFAVGLIWGVYGENGTADATFRYLEDGSLNTADEDEYELADDARVGLVHPVELSKEVLDAWKQQLEDYEIKQPIEQLSRPVARVSEEEANETSLDTFGGRVLNDLSLSGKLLGMGWYRGSVLDAGGFYDFYREDGPIGVQLNFSGSYVGGGFDEEVTVYDIQFYRSGTVRRGSYIYDSLGQPGSPDAPAGAAGPDFVLVGGVSRPSDKRLFKLGEVPARLFSEIVYQVQKATASSTETRDDWKDKR